MIGGETGESPLLTLIFSIPASHTITLLTLVGIIGQWIDDNFELHQEVVGFERLRDHHTGENMASIVLEILGNYGIADKLFCITTDNAGNNGTLCKSLEAKLAELGIPWDHEVKFCMDLLIVALSHSVFRTHREPRRSRVHRSSV